MRSIRNLKDVVDWGLCVGCGACAYACSRGAVEMENIEEAGLRPRFAHDACAQCSACLPVCPGYTVDSASFADGLRRLTGGEEQFGPVLGIWEGYAADPEIRHRGSSGGLLTALALYCLEREGMECVVHAGMDEAEPWKNKTVVSRGRDELLSRTGSRYAPASPCEGLGWIEKADGPCVFIGKPCDATGAELARRMRPELDRKLGAVLTFFCAGTPSTRGTLDLMQKLGAAGDETESVHYRGEGWPGRFRIRTRDGADGGSLSYSESWGELAKYRPFRCHLCPDGLGRIADLSCGDAWNEYEGPDGNEGRSLVLVRTRRGQEILHGAIEAGCVVLRPVGSQHVLDAQVNLLDRRRQIFGRLLAMKTLGVPTPRLRGYSLFRGWLGLPAGLKFRTVAGTLRRLIQRNLWRRRDPFETEPVKRGAPRASAAGAGETQR